MTRDPIVATALRAASDWAWLVNAGNLHRAVTRLHDLTPDGYPTSTLGGDGRGTSDLTPTERAAASVLHAHRRRLERHVRLAAAVMARIVADVHAVAAWGPDDTRGVDVRRESEHLRCDGGRGDWADPTCDRHGVAARWVDRDGHLVVDDDRRLGERRWLCDACLQRYKRWARTERERGVA